MRQFIDIIAKSNQSTIPSPNFLATLEEGMKENLKMLAGLNKLAEIYHLPSMRADIVSLEQLMRELKRSDRQVWAARYGRIEIALKWYGVSITVFRDSPILKKAMDDLEKHFQDELDLIEQEKHFQDELDLLARTRSDEEDYLIAQRQIEQQMRIASETELRRIYVAFQEEIGLLVDKYKAEFRKTIGYDYKPLNGFGGDTSYLSQIRRLILNHFLHINYSKIQNYTFRNVPFNTIYDDLSDLETEYKERVTGLLVMYEGDQIIKKVGDYVWVMLDRGYCRDEGDAMGHCGNAGASSGDRILSLRRFEKKIEGEDYYSVYLTFILDRYGKLGEMKGRANEKPAEKYHPYIIELLKMPIIKGIKGGGYLPENNFSVNDLSPEHQNELFELRPEMAGFVYRLQKYGDSEELRKDMIETIKAKDGYRGEYGPLAKLRFEDDKLVFRTFKNIQDLVDELSDDDLSKRIADDENLFDSWDFEVDNSQIADLIDKLELQRQMKIAEYVYELVKNEGDEDELEDFDMTSTSDVVNKLEDYDMDNYDVLKNAVRDGLSSGAEGEAISALKKSILEAQQSIEHGELDIPGSENDGKFSWDEEIKILLPISLVAKIIDEADTYDEHGDEVTNPIDDYANYFWPDEDGKPIKANEPYYGFSGYDEDYAFQRLLDEFSINGTLLGNIEIEKATEPKFTEMKKEEVIAWIQEMYDKIPDGFIRKVDLEKVDEWRIPQIARGLFGTYYGKSNA